MGLRFHKSIKLGKLLKLNINKGSISLTAGVKGAHVTVNNKGKKTASVGIPGSGLSYQKTLGSSKKKTKSKKENGILDNILDEVKEAAEDIKDDMLGNYANNNDEEENTETKEL